MPSTAQIEANRRNAKSSTGPRTKKGKEASSANATKFGLFSAKNCVHREEQEEYNDLSAALWDELFPVGAIEGMLAIEVVRCAWRLRRCAVAESQLSHWNRQEQLARLTKASDEHPDRLPADPLLYEYTAAPQSAIDRARGQAQSALRRAMSDLASRQTERMLRVETLQAGTDPLSLGLARVKDVLAGAALSERETRNARAQSAEQLRQLIQQMEAQDAQILEGCRLDRERELQNEAARNQSAWAQSASAQSAPTTPEPEAALKTERSQTAAPHSTADLREDSREDSEEHSAKASLNTKPVARNAACPCLSGLKFKRCCGKDAPAVCSMAA